MNKEKELPQRKSTRLKNFDYSSAGAYFVTICTRDRRCILSRIVGTGVLDCPKIELTKYGEIADKYINQLNDFYDYLLVESYVIMPNHIHILLFVRGNETTFADGQSRTPVPTDLLGFSPRCSGDGGASRTPVPTNVERANSVFSKFISTFKRFCNKEYGENIWQARSNDHIIRNREDYEEHIRYIYENPMNWYCDELYSEK